MPALLRGVARITRCWRPYPASASASPLPRKRVFGSRPFASSPPPRVYFERRRPGFDPQLDAQRRRRFIIAGVAAGGGVVYYVANLDYAPLTNRRRMIDVSRQQEMAIGLANFRQVRAQYESRILPPDSRTARYIERIGKRIAAAAEAAGNNAGDYEWEFIVVDSPEPNAFCLPGGKVCVFTGILPVLTSQDAVAAVLAHEVAHAMARHGAEKLAFSKVLFLLQLLINQFVDTRFLTNMLMQLLLNLPFSRRMESEADYIGLHLMVASCFNPSEMPRVFQRMADTRAQHMRGRKAPPSYLSTHPADDDRVRQLNEWLVEVMPEYERRCGGNGDGGNGNGFLSRAMGW